MIEKKLVSMQIEKLKGIKNCSLRFPKPLTAIMGVNGSGKTTILHALACIYKPETIGNEFKFSNFFVPTPHSIWEGSKLVVRYVQTDPTKKLKRRPRPREYYKRTSRWAPAYSTRPSRDVFYLGIDSCLPEIEKQRRNSFISFSTEQLTDKMSKKITRTASSILNKNYEILTKHCVGKKTLIGVRTADGLEYSSLSMGTGEQRVFKILEAIYKAPAYSMILIDEIDLLLHIDALRKLLYFLIEEAKSKHLQIVFTTHSLFVSNFDEIGIQYIEHTPEKTLTFDDINTGLIYSITGVQERPIRIFVEDTLSQAIVSQIAKELNMRKSVQIGLYGAAHNSFALVASYILKKENHDNVLVILDGDEYRGEEKTTQIRKVLSGTESDIEQRQNDALSLIRQFSIPEDIKPERYLHRILLSLPDCEIVAMAKQIIAVSDDHAFIDDIIHRFDDPYDVVMNEIINLISKSEEWSDYTKDVREWLQLRISL